MSTNRYTYTITPEECKDQDVFVCFTAHKPPLLARLSRSYSHSGSHSRSHRGSHSYSVGVHNTQEEGLRDLRKDVGRGVMINGKFFKGCTEQELEGHLANEFSKREIKQLLQHYSQSPGGDVGGRCGQVLSGFGIFFMATSPLGSIIPELKKPSYVLTPEGLYFVKDPIQPLSQEDFVKNSDQNNNALWMRLANSPKPGNFELMTLKKTQQAIITELTGHTLDEEYDYPDSLLTQNESIEEQAGYHKTNIYRKRKGFLRSAIFLEIDEVVPLNKFPGNESSTETCWVRAVCELTSEGFTLVSWHTNQKVIELALKGNRENFRQFLQWQQSQLKPNQQSVEVKAQPDQQLFEAMPESHQSQSQPVQQSNEVKAQPNQSKSSKRSAELKTNGQQPASNTIQNVQTGFFLVASCALFVAGIWFPPLMIFGVISLGMAGFSNFRRPPLKSIDEIEPSTPASPKDKRSGKRDEQKKSSSSALVYKKTLTEDQLNNVKAEFKSSPPKSEPITIPANPLPSPQDAAKTLSRKQTMSWPFEEDQSPLGRSRSSSMRFSG